MNLQPGVQIGDFRIERFLGQGGMGIVFLAQQVSLNRPVALKIMGPSLIHKADIARFQREAQAIAKLNHPGIAKVYYVGQDQQHSYLAMEYIEGDSLRIITNRLRAVRDPKRSIDSILQLRQEDGGVPPEMRFDIPTDSNASLPNTDGAPDERDSLSNEARQLIESKDYIRWCCEIVRDTTVALAHAHERGVVHRDIKPENLLLDSHGVVHIVDFGLARFFEDVSVTSSGALVGTPVYMSPEQVSGRLQIDHRTDIYSLGLMLYELLTLRRPIQASTREAVIRQVVTKALPPVSWSNRAISRNLESIVHKATAKDPDERYNLAENFSIDIQNFLDSKPVFATHYKFLLDRRTIVAERPWAISVISVGLISLSVMNIFDFFSSLPFSNLLPPIEFSNKTEFAGKLSTQVVEIDSLLVSVVLPAVCLSLAFGLLRGRKWARLCSLLYFTISITYNVWWCFGLVASITFQRQLFVFSLRNLLILFTFNIVNHLIHIIFSAFSIVNLIGRRSKEWFYFAERLRSEHQRNAPPR